MERRHEMEFQSRIKLTQKARRLFPIMMDDAALFSQGRWRSGDVCNVL